MEEQIKEQPVKKEWTPDQIMAKHIRTMSNRQLSNRLRRLARQHHSNMDNAWAVVLSIVFDNSRTSQIGGRMDAYLR